MRRSACKLLEVADIDNLQLAYLQARRGKSDKKDVQLFSSNLNENLSNLSIEVLEERIVLGEYRCFTVFEPKKRIIQVAPFRDRVLHHSLINICEPVFEKYAICDSYACRKGKGSLSAVLQAKSFSAKYGYFLKMDVRKYFDSIDHNVLNILIARKFKDQGILRLFAKIIDSFSLDGNVGLPIGNLTSQHLSNFYLGFLDHFVKEQLREKAYVRYMDDFVLWSDDRHQLKKSLNAIRELLEHELHLQMRNDVLLNRSSAGLNFLGYRVFPDKIRLSRKSKSRFLVKFRKLEENFLCNAISEQELSERMSALIAFTQHAESLEFRKEVIKKYGCIS